MNERLEHAEGRDIAAEVEDSTNLQAGAVSIAILALRSRLVVSLRVSSFRIRAG